MWGPPSTLSRNHIVHVLKKSHSKKFCLIFLVNTDQLVVKSIEKVRVEFFFSLEDVVSTKRKVIEKIKFEGGLISNRA